MITIKKRTCSIENVKQNIEKQRPWLNMVER